MLQTGVSALGHGHVEPVRPLGAAQKGYTGIGIDEFAAGDRRFATKMVTALALTRWRYPRLSIAAWQAGRLTGQPAEAHANYASLVVLEAYAPDRRVLAKLTTRSLAVARAAGILQKTVIGLGISGLDPQVGRTWSAWANAPEEIE